MLSHDSSSFVDCCCGRTTKLEMVWHGTRESLRLDWRYKLARTKNQNNTHHRIRRECAIKLGGVCGAWVSKNMISTMCATRCSSVRRICASVGRWIVIVCVCRLVGLLKSACVLRTAHRTEIVVNDSGEERSIQWLVYWNHYELVQFSGQQVNICTERRGWLDFFACTEAMTFNESIFTFCIWYIIRYVWKDRSIDVASKRLVKWSLPLKHTKHTHTDSRKPYTCRIRQVRRDRNTWTDGVCVSCWVVVWRQARLYETRVWKELTAGIYK